MASKKNLLKQETNRSAYTKLFRLFLENMDLRSSWGKIHGGSENGQRNDRSWKKYRRTQFRGPRPTMKILSLAEEVVGE